MEKVTSKDPFCVYARDLKRIYLNIGFYWLCLAQIIRKLFSYFRYVSQALFHLMETMHEIVGRPLYTHCAGHSLGGHVCGLTGKLLKASRNTPTFDRISAMDPGEHS